jgi:hypothetical protein
VPFEELCKLLAISGAAAGKVAAPERLRREVADAAGGAGTVEARAAGERKEE